MIHAEFDLQGITANAQFYSEVTERLWKRIGQVRPECHGKIRHVRIPCKLCQDLFCKKLVLRSAPPLAPSMRYVFALSEVTNEATRERCHTAVNQWECDQLKQVTSGEFQECVQHSKTACEMHTLPCCSGITINVFCEQFQKFCHDLSGAVSTHFSGWSKTQDSRFVGQCVWRLVRLQQWDSPLREIWCWAREREGVGRVGPAPRLTDSCTMTRNRTPGQTSAR